MRIHVEDISLKTEKKMEILDVTHDVEKIVGESGIKNGLVNLWIPHATAALAVNEHDLDLWDDILSTMRKLVPVEADYRHNTKYAWTPREQNAHAHIINCIVKPNAVIPLHDGRMQLGTWQSILFIELDGPRSRSIHVQIMGE